MDKKQQKRWEEAQSGMAELEQMLRDLARSGLLSIPDKGAAFFEQCRRRLFDTKARPLATLVQEFDGDKTQAQQRQWQEAAYERMAKLWLAVQGLKHVEQLPPSAQEDLKVLYGWMQRRNDLKDNPDAEVVSDQWLVAGKWVREEMFEVIAHQFYLYGLKTGRQALILEYQVKSPPPVVPLPMGGVLQATLRFYPSNLPFRAILESEGDTHALGTAPKCHADWHTAQDAVATAIAQKPWADEFVLPIADLLPIQHAKGWFLQDHLGRGIAIHPAFGETQRWKLLALSGGAPCSMVVLYAENCALPLGCFKPAGGYLVF